MGADFAHFPIDGSLPRNSGGSASALPISRPAQRSLALRPARSPSPLKDPLHRRLQQLRYLHCCSDCFRLERQLPGGVRTRWKTAPFHGARKVRLAIIALLACAGTLLAHVITAESRRSKLLESRLEAMTHALMSLAETSPGRRHPALRLSAPFPSKSARSPAAACTTRSGLPMATCCCAVRVRPRTSPSDRSGRVGSALHPWGATCTRSIRGRPPRGGWSSRWPKHLRTARPAC